MNRKARSIPVALTVRRRVCILHAICVPLEQADRKVRRLTRVSILRDGQRLAQVTLGGSYTQAQAMRELRSNPTRFGLTDLPADCLEVEFFLDRQLVAHVSLPLGYRDLSNEQLLAELPNFPLTYEKGSELAISLGLLPAPATKVAA